METIRDCMKNNNTCVIALRLFMRIMEQYIYIYRVLTSVIYSVIDNYICIDYLSCQSKILSNISSNKMFKQTSFNILLGIGIP